MKSFFWRYKEAGSFSKDTALPGIKHCRPEPPPTATGIGSPVVAASSSQLPPRISASHPDVLPPAVAATTTTTTAATATKTYVVVPADPMPLPSCEVRSTHGSSCSHPSAADHRPWYRLPVAVLVSVVVAAAIAIRVDTAVSENAATAGAGVVETTVASAATARAATTSLF